MTEVGQRALRFYRPGEYENRFRDPVFLTVWQRWQNARNMWRKAGDSLDFSQGGPDSRYNPDPLQIKSEKQRAEATEFLEARKAYLRFVARLTP